MHRDPQYIDLDVAPVFKEVPVDQLGVVVASTIENKTWYAYEDPRINSQKMRGIVNKLKKTNRSSFPSVWNELKDYADDHNIWINEE